MAKYQQYADYKDVQNEWISSVPSDWKVVPLKALCLNPVKDGPHETPIFIDEGIPFLSVDGIQNNQLVFEGCRYISVQDHEKYSRKCAPAKGDILLGKAASVGKVAYVNTEIDFNVWSPLAVITPKTTSLSKYIFYAFQSTMLQAQCEVYSNSNTQKNLGMNTIDNLHLPFPSYKEAETIANFLDYETAQIDTLIDKQQTLIQLLKEKRQALISHAVTHDKNEKAAKLGYFIDLLSGYSFPSDGYKIEPEGNTALLRGINVGIGTLKWDETVWWSRTERDGLEAFELEEGDIVFGMDRPWISAGARVAEVIKSDLPCLLLQRVIRIRANKNTYQPFIKLCLASKEFKFSVEADLTGVSVPHISPDQVKSFPIRDIGYEQQKLITDDAFEKMKVLDLIEDSAEQAIQLMQERRTALISAAVTGKIDVRGWRAAELL